MRNSLAKLRHLPLSRSLPLTCILLLGISLLAFWLSRGSTSNSAPHTVASSSRAGVKKQTSTSPKVDQPSAAPTTPPASQSPAQTPTQPAPTPAAPQLPDDASYHVVINKKHPISPIDYAPPDLTPIGSQRLRAAAASAVQTMQNDSGSNIIITPASGYRSYATQTSVYNNYVSQYGQASADTFSARPGYSEHQSGLAIDFSPIDVSFASTAQFTWLTHNAYRYGFVLRYPEGKTYITGYTYEPWHWRYVGVTTATDMHNRGIPTLEDYYGVEGGDY
jgi:D-alanyl-D-alanine carboxypeptidase